MELIWKVGDVEDYFVGVDDEDIVVMYYFVRCEKIR